MIDRNRLKATYILMSVFFNVGWPKRKSLKYPDTERRLCSNLLDSMQPVSKNLYLSSLNWLLNLSGQISYTAA